MESGLGWSAAVRDSGTVFKTSPHKSGPGLSSTQHSRFFAWVRSSLYLCALTSVLVLAVLPARSLAGATFALHIRPYCMDPNCRHPDWPALQEYVCRAVEELNLEYRQAGFSFRPTLFPNAPFTPSGGIPGFPTNKNQYGEISTGNACRGGSPNDSALASHWKSNVAQANPNAISIMVSQNAGTCCSPVPTTYANGADLHGLLCDVDPGRGILNIGTGWAHEMGHHWGLVHTFTYQDPATHPNPDYDGDDVVLKNNGDTDQLPIVQDTPDDPEVFEACPKYCGGNANNDRCKIDTNCTGTTCQRVCNAGHDEDASGNLRDGHVWITFGSIVNGADTNVPATDFHYNYCDTAWISRSGGVTIGTTPAVTHTHNAMSYYGGPCRAPYVVGGNPVWPFGPNQLARMQATRSQISVRNAGNLPDVCIPWGDTDKDGVCDNVDTCPNISNLCDQVDTDGDEWGDQCDNCPNDYNPLQTNTDGLPDGGDACDDDDDEDGCYDWDDQHPNQRMVVVGQSLASACGIKLVPIYGDESENLDPWQDDLPNCMDWDDDGDGLCDADWVGPECDGVEPDPCPTVPGFSCFGAGGSPINCPPPWLVCAGGGCVEFFAKMTLVINPDPTRDVIFDRFRIVDQVLYVMSGQGIHTPSQMARGIGNLANEIQAIGIGGELNALAATQANAPEPWLRLEIWRRATDTAGETLAAVVGQWPASAIQFGEFTRAPILRLTPTEDVVGRPGALHVAATWALGMEEGTELPDTDEDGWPDIADNCVATANPDQLDTDGDGFGNRCDPDLDNDGEVTEDDVARARACEGADLSIYIPLLEGPDLGGNPDAILPDPVAAAMATACKSADVTGDGVVDGEDTAYVRSHLGETIDIDTSKVSPLPTLTTACIEPVPFEPVKIDIMQLHRMPGTQKFMFKGEMVLPYPFSPALDPADNGLGFMVRTAQGNSLLDVHIPPVPDGGDLADWRVHESATGVQFRNISPASGATRIALEWGDTEVPGRITAHIMVKHANLMVAEEDLPIFAQLTLNGSMAASRQCARTAFQQKPEQPYCMLKGNRSRVVCRTAAQESDDSDDSDNSSDSGDSDDSDSRRHNNNRGRGQLRN